MTAPSVSRPDPANGVGSEEALRGGRGGRDRGVSQVIAVVLLVAVTVTLSASIGGYFSSYVNEQTNGGVQAGADLEADVSANSFTVTFVAAQQEGATLTVTVEETTNGHGGVYDPGAVTLTAVGETVTFDDPDLGDGDVVTVAVVARADGQESLVASRTIRF